MALKEFEEKYKLANNVVTGPKLRFRKRRNVDILRSMLQLEEDFSYDKSHNNSKDFTAKKLFSKN